MKKVLIALLILTEVCFASTDSFKYKDSYASFVDFKTASYEIEIDLKKRTTYIISTIAFTQDQTGYTVFDLIPAILSMKVNGIETTAQDFSPTGSNTKFKVSDLKLPKGNHIMVIKSELDGYSRSIDWDIDYLDYDFLLSDLSDREFLEIYFPSNFEYDQLAIDINLTILNSQHEHLIYTNGSVTKVKKNQFKISFPSYFNSSAMFFHIAAENKYDSLDFTYSSISGKQIPIKIYSEAGNDASEYSEYTGTLSWAKEETLNTLKELEKTIGAWPHSKLLINLDGGGMEAHGAAHAGKESLRHEIIHSYFGRGVMPKDGKSGWIDEALTYWIEEGYKSSSSCSGLCLLSINSYPKFTRHTCEDQSGTGAFLNFQLSMFGGLKPFLPYFFNKYKFKLITTEIFKLELESFYNINLDSYFNSFIYGEPSE